MLAIKKHVSDSKNSAEYDQDQCCHIDEEFATANYIWIHWGTGDFKMTGLRWFNSTCNYLTNWGADFPNKGDSKYGHGICVGRPESIDSVIGLYD